MSEIVPDTHSSIVVTQEAIQSAVVYSGDTIAVDSGTPVVVVAGLMGPPGAYVLGNLKDVDTSQLQDGGLLVYTQATQKWTATNTLERQILEGGQF